MELHFLHWWFTIGLILGVCFGTGFLDEFGKRWLNEST